MPGEMEPSSKKDAPDPSNSYERAHPERESAGKMDAQKTPTHKTPDAMHKAVKHKQSGGRQLNGGDAVNKRGGATSEQPTHSMKDEEPTDADLSPADIKDPKNKRHPRTGGKGGTPDAGDANRDG